MPTTVTVPPGFRALVHGERIEGTDYDLWPPREPRQISVHVPHWVGSRIGHPGFSDSDNGWLIIRRTEEPRIQAPQAYRALRDGERMTHTDFVIWRTGGTPESLAERYPAWLHHCVGDEGFTQSGVNWLVIRRLTGTLDDLTQEQQAEALQHFRHAIRARQLEWEATRHLERVLGRDVNLAISGWAANSPDDVSQITLTQLREALNERN